MSAPATDELYLDLETDKVLSEGQLLRHYDCSLEELSSSILAFSAFLSTTHHSMTYREVRFVTLKRKHTRQSASALRHLAGVAEMRRLLGAPRNRWSSEAGASFASEIPDALWHSPNGVTAIEFDAGSYTAQKIRQKIYAFGRFEGQVWGSSSRRRVEHLRKLLQDVGEPLLPLFASWH